ncbi:MAG: FHA domain-containing protein [Atopobiaceae bacterium]|nr:FHA domain-containing protein [Atopobiaceae bacterium]
MRNTLLAITFLCDGRAQTLPFDTLVQSVVWIGTHASATTKDAVLCVEREGHGLKVNTMREGWALALPGQRPPSSSVVLRCEVATLVGIVREGTRGGSALYVRPVVDGMRRFELRTLPAEGTWELGRLSGCDICYGTPYVSASHARLTCHERRLAIEDLRSGNGTIVNESVIAPYMPYELEPGDEVRILDWVFVVGKGFLCTNCPPGLSLEPLAASGDEAALPPCIHEKEKHKAAEHRFHPAPRIVRTIHALSLAVDGPPSLAEHKEQSALMRMGPSLLMGLSASFMLAGSAQRVFGGASLLESMPAIALVVTLMAGSVLWPLASGRYERRSVRVANTRRSQRYVAYLDKIERALIEESHDQKRVLRENRLPVQEVLRMASERSALLMSRTQDHEDYLCVRVGTGDAPLSADVAWPEHPFSLVDDDMWNRLERLRNQMPQLDGVPLALSLVAHPSVGIYGDRALVWEFVRGVLVQVCACHSYREVRIALVVGESDRDEWAPFVPLRHMYDSRGENRYLAVTPEGMMRLDAMLEELLCLHDVPASGPRSRPERHCVIVCSNLRLFLQSTVLGSISAQGALDGRASLVFVGESTEALPRSCTYLVDLSGEHGACDERALRSARMFARDDVLDTLVTFLPDIMVSREEGRRFALDMGRLRLAESEVHRRRPSLTAFLELYEVGSVAHLNIGERWREHDASRNLLARLGVDGLGNVVCLDLHEDGQGPHGLIAGTTGSGKSEFIATLILSLCVNYAPSEVSILVIDYKGGGLAGVFDAEPQRLPHLCGTITNLDGSVIRRSLVSLRSELERRQRMLNAARARTGESTMDVRRYQSLYRQGRVHEPMPHLVVVADEFAELKQQEPEFMDQLITSARIGRSLGVHLVLATQKPTGVVDDQIWSNARFKACLKVSDVTDSREMIRRDDAARLDRPGRFCLLVGYDEAFLEGQAAYAGEPYVPRTRLEPRRDTSVRLLGKEGEVVLRRDACGARRVGTCTELQAVLEELAHTARMLNEQALPLWLAPLPERLAFDPLALSSRSCAATDLTCVLAMVDDPWNQRQDLMLVSLLEVGNLVLYGPQNSGVEEMAKATLAALAYEHGTSELWLYGIDSGNYFTTLEQLPQWGGTVHSADEDGLFHLLRMLSELVTHRRSEGGTSWPQVVVALTGLSSWLEACERLEDELEHLTRDGPRYGVHLVIVAHAVHDVRMRLRANLGFELAVSLRDAGEYALLLGSLGGVPMPKGKMRGLVRKDDRVLEFVGMCLANDAAGELEIVSEVVAHAHGMASEPVPPIPRVPASVTAAELVGRIRAGGFPIGFDKADAAPFWMELRRDLPLLATGGDRQQLDSFLVGACETLDGMGVSTCFVDAWGHVPSVLHVRTLGPAEVGEALRANKSFGRGYQVVVINDVLRLLEHLASHEAALLQDILVRALEYDLPPFVLGAESWRLGSVFDNWLKHVQASGRGLWVGEGFATQTVFPLPRLTREHRLPVRRLDGFAVLGGSTRAVRFVRSSTFGAA